MSPANRKILVDWIIANRRGMAFKDYPFAKIDTLVQESANEDLLCISYKEGKLNGIVCGTRTAHGIWIHDILTTERGVMKKFLQFYVGKFGQTPILGEAHGRLRLFIDPAKVERKAK
jgi:hypothetical protein